MARASNGPSLRRPAASQLGPSAVRCQPRGVARPQPATLRSQLFRSVLFFLLRPADRRSRDYISEVRNSRLMALLDHRGCELPYMLPAIPLVPVHAAATAVSGLRIRRGSAGVGTLGAVTLQRSRRRVSERSRSPRFSARLL